MVNDAKVDSCEQLEDRGGVIEGVIAERSFCRKPVYGDWQLKRRVKNTRNLRRWHTSVHTISRVTPLFRLAVRNLRFFSFSFCTRANGNKRVEKNWDTENVEHSLARTATVLLWTSLGDRCADGRLTAHWNGATLSSSSLHRFTTDPVASPDGFLVDREGVGPFPGPRPTHTA